MANESQVQYIDAPWYYLGLDIIYAIYLLNKVLSITDCIKIININ